MGEWELYLFFVRWKNDNGTWEGQRRILTIITFSGRSIVKRINMDSDIWKVILLKIFMCLFPFKSLHITRGNLHSSLRTTTSGCSLTTIQQNRILNFLILEKNTFISVTEDCVLTILIDFGAQEKIPKNWCFWTAVLEKTLEHLLDCKEIKPVNPKINQPWIFIGRTDAEAATPVLWPPHAKSWLIGKDIDAGGYWGQEKKGTTEDEMAGWHPWLDGRESEWTPGAGDGQGGLACCDSCGRKESDTTEQLNWTELFLLPALQKC